MITKSSCFTFFRRFLYWSEWVSGWCLWSSRSLCQYRRRYLFKLFFFQKLFLSNFYFENILFRVPMYLWSWLCIWEKNLCWHWWMRQQSMCQWKLCQFGRRFQMPMSRRIQPRTWWEVKTQIHPKFKSKQNSENIVQIEFSLQTWHEMLIWQIFQTSIIYFRKSGYRKMNMQIFFSEIMLNSVLLCSGHLQAGS